MATMLTELFSTFMSGLGLRLVNDPEMRRGWGLTYEPDPDMGTGSYWVYPLTDACVISICNLTLKADMDYRQTHPPFLYIGQYDSGPLPRPAGPQPKNALVGYVGKHEEYRMRLKTGISVSSVGISMTREFCENILGSCPQTDKGEDHPGTVQGLAQALERLDGSVSVPELTYAFHQLRAFRPARPVASVYYESKTKELLAYLMQWQLLSEAETPERIPDSDTAGLDRVERHLRHNYARSADLGQLAAMACMSRNKLTALFKRTRGRTITEHVHELRLERARDLLLHSDWKIEAIAREVGYRDHGSFSKLFRRSTGMTPRQFRHRRLSATFLA